MSPKTVERKTLHKDILPATSFTPVPVLVPVAHLKKLLAVMAAKGFTRAAIARELDVSPSYLEPVFAATPKLNIRKLIEVGEVLGVDVWRLLAVVSERRRSATQPWTAEDLKAIASKRQRLVGPAVDRPGYLQGAGGRSARLAGRADPNAPGWRCKVGSDAFREPKRQLPG